MLVKLSGEIVDKAQSNGNDILFTQADGTTKLLHEIESFNGELIAWVQVPHLSEQTDTILYIYYGNPEADSQQSPDRVFDPNTYAGVWHLNQDPVTTQQDSTANANNGTPENIDRGDGVAAGKVGGAVNFDGSVDKIITQDIETINNADVTFSFWARVDSLSKDHDFITKGTHDSDEPVLIFFDNVVSNSSDVGDGNIDTLSALTYDGSVYHWVAATNNALSNNDWNHISVVVEPGNSRTSLYINGTLNQANAKSWGGMVNNSESVRFGGDTVAGTGPDLDGSMDEVRIASTARSGAWITTEYRNQCGCEDFLTVGELEEYISTTDAMAAAAQPAVAGVGNGRSTTLTLSSPLIQSINALYRTAYTREPTFTDWLYWAGRVLAQDKTTLPELLGAMQWQALFK